MADFVKKTWACGDDITANDLNRMEDGIEEALSGGGDPGYSCTETTTLLTDESVTTEDDGGYGIGRLAYTTPITAETIRVTYDGEEYICDAQGDNFGVIAYGATSTDLGFDWSEYPFVVESGGLMGNEIKTETVGTHQVKIETLAVSVMTTPCFERAVKSISSCEETEVSIVKSNSIHVPTGTGSCVNTEIIEVQPNSVATFNTSTVSNTTLDLLPILGFKCAEPSIVIQSITKLPNHQKGFEVTVRNTSNSAVNIQVGQLSINVLLYKKAVAQTYSLCGTESGESPMG